MGGVLRYKLEVYRQYSSDKLYGLGVPKQSPLGVPRCVALFGNKWLPESAEIRGPIWLDDRGVGQLEVNGGSSGCTSLAPLASPCFVLCLIGAETEGLLDYEGRAGIISIVWWSLRTVIFGVEKWNQPSTGKTQNHTKTAKSLYKRRKDTKGHSRTLLAHYWEIIKIPVGHS